MNLAGPFIRRPVMTSLVMLGLVIFGIMAYRYLPVSDLPNVDFPTLQVSATLPGASAETMAASVATPLERQFSTIAGLESMSSSSSQGQTRIILQFSLERPLDAAAQDVQAAISIAAAQLPPTLPSPPTLRKVNPADQPVIYLGIVSERLPLYVVNEYADTFLAQRISMVSGVAQVMVYGAQKYAVRIQVDPWALAGMGLGLDEVARAVSTANVNLPTGVLEGAPPGLHRAGHGPVAGRPRLPAADHGLPGRQPRLPKRAGPGDRQRGEQPAGLLVQPDPGHGAGRAAPAGHQHHRGGGRGAQAAALLPGPAAGRHPAPHTLRPLPVHPESVNDVKFTLLLAVALVVMVVFLFLRNLSATLITSLALPTSIIGTFAVMHQMGFSLDNLSLMALTLSVGFVVDDAIVMLENIVRHQEQGESMMQAALKGSREIGFTVVSMTISLVAVFIPVLFMGGLMGRLLHEFAVTISAAILVSGVVSLTLTPMLCSRFLRAPPGGGARPAVPGLRARLRRGPGRLRARAQGGA